MILRDLPVEVASVVLKRWTLKEVRGARARFASDHERTY